MTNSSTLTFLFTDIEGSTRLWDNQPDHMRTALARHDSIMRDAVKQGAGQVFKTIGDAFCAAFSSPTGAVCAALEAQLRLAGEDWEGMDPIRVRMAIHTGEADCRDDDYFGPTLNRVNRMLHLGHGTQVLVSQATYALICESPPASTTFRDLGEHRLKDLQRPEQIYQLLHPLLHENFKPLRSLDTLPNNLPQQATSFVGRDRELREIKRLLTQSRLLTLVGAGGTGKTRLGLQAAVEMLDPSGDGSWFVEFASITDPALVPQTIASTLGVREEPTRPLADTLIEYLKTRRMLIVVDNAEHLISSIAQIADQIIRNCPNIQILATSREPLTVNGEQIYRVPSLSTPDPEKQYDRETLLQFESIKLFIERAELASPSFAMTAVNSASIAQICHRLGGIPFAIELAAARVAALQVERIAERLDDRFRLLTGGSRTALPRQQTLKAMVDWSYDLLNDSEKLLFRRIAVFSGGFTLEAAEAVCIGGAIEAWEVLDLLQSLVVKSLVVFDDPVQRYRVSETVRAYGRDALHATGDASDIRSRHLAYFGDVVTTTEDSLTSPQAVKALSTLETEQKNLRAAVEWGLEEGDVVEATRLANALSMFFQVRGEFTEGSSIYQALLARIPCEAKPERASALAALGVLSFRLTHYSSAQRALEEGLALFLELGDEFGAARAVNTMGVISLQLGNYDEAATSFERALGLFKNVGEPRRIAMTLNNLGILAVHHNDLARARQLYNEALELNQKVGNRAFEAGNRTNLADLALREGDAATARTMAREACEMHLELGDRLNLQDTLEVLAPAERLLGRPRVAALLFATKEALMEQLGTKVAPYVLEEYHRNVSAVRDALGDHEFEEITARGRLMTLEEAYRASLAE